MIRITNMLRAAAAAAPAPVMTAVIANTVSYFAVVLIQLFAFTVIPNHSHLLSWFIFSPKNPQFHLEAS